MPDIHDEVMEIRSALGVCPLQPAVKIYRDSGKNVNCFDEFGVEGAFDPFFTVIAVKNGCPAFLPTHNPKDQKTA